MKKTIKFFVLFLVSIFLISFSYSIDKDLIKKFEDSPGTLMYSDSYIYTLLYSMNIEYDLETNEFKKNVIDFYQIMNRGGRDKFGDYRIRFSEDKDKINVIESFTLNKEELKITPVEDKAVNTVTPPSLQGASLYSNISDRVYSFSNIDPEDALYIEYNKTRKVDIDSVNGTFIFQNDNPIGEKKLEIKIPDNIELYKKSKGENIEFSSEKTNNCKVYKWEKKDLPKIEIEEYKPYMFFISPSVTFSTSNDWGKIIEQLFDEYTKKTKPDKIIKKKAKKITRGVKNDLEKIINIYKFITKEIKPINLPLGLDGYEPHKASIVLKNGYGDIRDKTALLLSFLKALKYRCFPVFVPVERKPEKELVVMDQFSTIFVGVELNGKTIYLDPNGEYNLLGYYNLRKDIEGLAINESKDKWIKLNYYNNIKNKVSTDIELELKNDVEFYAKIKVNSNGYFDRKIRRDILLMSKDEKNKFFDRSANIFSEGARTIDYIIKNGDNILKPVIFEHNIGGKNLYVTQGNISIFTIPDIPYSYASFPFSLSLKERKYPIYFGRKFEVQEKWNIAIAKKVKFLHIPETISITNEMYSFEQELNISEQGNVYLKRKICIKKPVFSVEEYKRFKKDFDLFNEWKKKTLLFEEKK